MSPTTRAVLALRTDWHDDAAGASPPPSRYLNYLQMDGRESQLRGLVDDDDVVGWLHVLAKVARGPIMSTPPVHVVHPLVMGWTVERDQYDGGAVAQLAIAAAPQLTDRLPSSIADRPLRGWHYDHLMKAVREPDPDATATFVTTSVLTFPLDLTTARECMTADPHLLLGAARMTLDDVVEQVNEAAAPVLARIASPVLPSLP